MITSDKMYIQWSQFQTQVSQSFQNLRLSEELFDVTLACEDETVEAHKVIISACSLFFRHVLNKTKQNHPFIYLKGVLHKDLLAILDFIYSGETQVPAEDVNRFIEAAQELKIKELSEDRFNTLKDNEEVNQDKSQKEMSEIKNVTIGEEILNITSENDVVSELSCTFCEREFKTKPYLIKHISQFHTESLQIKEEYLDISMNQKDQTVELRKEISKRIEKVMDSEEGTMWRCTVCSKKLKKKDEIEYHVETHLDGFAHKCLILQNV